jgi:hypothetical protein
MKLSLTRALAAALTGWLAAYSAWPAVAAGPMRPPSDSDIAILQIHLLEGEGLVVPAGSKSGRGIIVQVTDETGRPVEAAAVSFLLPGDGPSGTFSSGLTTEVVVTGADGRAVSYGISWNRLTGPLQMRVTASKGAVRAGTLIPLYVAEAAAGKTENQKAAARPGSSRTRWLLLGLLAAGAGGGAALALGRSGSSASGGGVPPAGVTTGPVVGAPSISIGRP